MCSQWSSLAVSTQLFDYLLGGDYNFNLRGVLEMSKVPGGMTMSPMIGAPSKSKMEH